MRYRGSLLGVCFVLAITLSGGAAWSASFGLASRTFAGNGTMPNRTAYAGQGCGGQNISPELHWSDPPRATRSFALTLWDPDAPAPGGWWHWVLYDLAASARGLSEGHAIGTSGLTSFGSAGYGGPCPPPGKPHHYVFTLYALDLPRLARLDRSEPLTGPQLQQRVRGHVLASATLVGLYAR